MKVTRPIPLALMAIAIGCSRSALDVPGGVGQDSGVALEGTPTLGDGDSSASDANAMGDDTGASSRRSDASEVGSEAEGGEGDGWASDAPPELPCLDRRTVDCDCSADVCSSQYVRLSDAILNHVSCLACLINDFTFDANGCVTGYSHASNQAADDACVLRALANVRFSCATGVSQPFSVYNSCTIAP